MRTLPSATRRPGGSGTAGGGWRSLTQVSAARRCRCGEGFSDRMCSGSAAFSSRPMRTARSARPASMPSQSQCCSFRKRRTPRR